MPIVAQPAPARIYFANNLVIRTNAAGSLPVESFSAGLVSVYPVGNLIAFEVDNATDYYRPDQFLNSSGVAYGTTVLDAINGYLANVAANSLTPATLSAAQTDINNKVATATQKAADAAASATAAVAAFKGAWTANTVYNTGDQVTNGGNTYRAKTNFTSGSSFNETNWDKIAQGGGPSDGSVSLPQLAPDVAAKITLVDSFQWGNLYISGQNKIVNTFAAISFFKWDNLSGAQAANTTMTKVASNNVTSMRIVTASGFSNAAPSAEFSGTRILPFTSADELKVTLATSIAGTCMMNFDLLDASQTVIVSAEYVQLTNGNSAIYTTANASVKYIRLANFAVSYARVSGSNVATNFSGASDTTFTFLIADKGYSTLKSLKDKLTELATPTFVDNSIAGAKLLDASLSQAKVDAAFSTLLANLQWGSLYISGYNKTLSNFALTTFFPWDTPSSGTGTAGAQAGRVSVSKVAANNITSIRIQTTSAFSSSAPTCEFTATRILPFTSADELKVTLATSIAGTCLMDFDLLDASQSVLSSAEYVQLSNGNSGLYTTANANVRYIRLNRFAVSYARVSGSNVITNFSGVSDTTFTFLISDKGSSTQQTLLAKLSDLSASQAAVVNLQNWYGDTCKLQIDKGKYQFPTSASVTTSAGVSVSFDSSMNRFSKKAVRIAVLNTAVVDTDGTTSRGVVTLQLPTFTPTKSVGFWIRVPSDYLMNSERAGAAQKKSFAQMTLRFYNGTSLLYSKDVFPEYDMNAGWSLYKILADNLNGVTITSVTIQVYTYNRTPELVFWIDSFVADQFAQPVLTMTMDNDLDDRTVASGWTDYITTNNIPLSCRVYLDSTGASSAGRQLAKRLYELGQVDSGAYSNNARTATTYSAAVDALKNDVSFGRLTILGKGFASRDLIESHNAHNYLDDALMMQEVDAGFRILRTSSSYKRSNYIDAKSPAIPCTQFGLFSSLAQIDDTFVANAIQAGKDYIDQLIKYGSFGSILTHQMVTRAQANSGDVSLAGLYEVHVGIYNYALTKVATGELRLMTLTQLYRACV